MSRVFLLPLILLCALLAACGGGDPEPEECGQHSHPAGTSAIPAAPCADARQ